MRFQVCLDASETRSPYVIQPGYPETCYRKGLVSNLRPRHLGLPVACTPVSGKGARQTAQPRSMVAVYRDAPSPPHAEPDTNTAPVRGNRMPPTPRPTRVGSGSGPWPPSLGPGLRGGTTSPSIGATRTPGSQYLADRKQLRPSQQA